MNGLSVVEFEVVFVVEDTFVVFLVIVTFAKAEADDGVACGIEDDEGVGGTLVAMEVFERGRGAKSLSDDLVFFVENSLNAGPIGVGFE